MSEGHPIEGPGTTGENLLIAGSPRTKFPARGVQSSSTVGSVTLTNHRTMPLLARPSRPRLLDGGVQGPFSQARSVPDYALVRLRSCKEGTLATAHDVSHRGHQLNPCKLEVRQLPQRAAYAGPSPNWIEAFMRLRRGMLPHVSRA